MEDESEILFISSERSQYMGNVFIEILNALDMNRVFFCFVRNSGLKTKRRHIIEV